MNRKIQIFVVALATAGLAACGGGDVDTIECADGAVEDNGQCVPEQDECADGEVRDEVLDKCVRAADDYCADDTEFDEQSQRCVAHEVECGDDTVVDDGQCVAEGLVECGTGTVADGRVCRAIDDICGENTSYDVDECRPIDGVCGEGTTFDIANRLCVPTSDLECGPGTVENDNVCIPKQTFYDDLASDPDIDLTVDGADTNFELADEGQRVVFVGNIDEPGYDDGEPVQDQDVLEFDADAGQWLEITVYSMGLPEPGFEFSQPVDDGFFRLSDLGAGIETSREVLVQHDDSYQLAVSNMPQMLGDLSPAGGEGWGYVGYVETLATPDSEDFDLLDDTLSGDIRDLSDNYYAVDATGVESVAMIFSEIPTDTDAEFQVWTDETTYDTTIDLGDDSFSFDPPADSFFVTFDRSFAYGSAVDYSVSAQTGDSADIGDAITQDIDLEAGDYVGLFQYNLEGLSLSASIYDGDEHLTSTTSLEVSNAEEGQLGLYWRAESAKTVTLELQNTTGQNLGFLSFEPVVGTTDFVDGIDGSKVDTDYDQTLPRGHRHFYELEIDYNGDLSLRTEETGGSDTWLTLYDEDGDTVADGLNAAIFAAEPQTYILEVEALSTIGDGFVLSAEETQLYSESSSSNPGTEIPDNDPDGITDTLSIDSCPYIEDVEVTLDISHPWRNDLIVEVTAPTGDKAVLHDRDGGSSEDINATYPFPDNSGVQPGHELSDGADLLDLLGTNGSGSWEIHVSDNEFLEVGTLNSWTVDLSCEG